MRIYIVRHGETEYNKEELFRGRKDIPLNDIGQKQARLLGMYFMDKGIGRIFVSPLARAQQTAHGISEAISVPIEIIEEFTDMHFGIWEGLPLRDVEERYPVDLAVWRNFPERLQVGGGETLEMVRQRISGGFMKAVSAQEGSIAVVTHRVVCKVIVLQSLKIGDEHFWDMKYDPGSVTLLEKKNNQFTLISSNDTCHLREEVPVSGYLDF